MCEVAQISVGRGEAVEVAAVVGIDSLHGMVVGIVINKLKDVLTEKEGNMRQYC